MKKQLYYVIQTLIRGRDSNIIKVISLTLGLAVSILIFTREMFELRFDTCYPNYEHLCAVKVTSKINNEVSSSFMTMGPTAEAITENFPKGVKSATVTLRWGSNALFYGKHRFIPDLQVVDTCFFSTIGTKILSGDPKELANPDVLFISKHFAEDIFVGKNPIGEILHYNKTMPMTIKGVYEDFPENSSFYNVKVLMSMPTVIKYEWAYWGWNVGDSYFSFVRLNDDVDRETINQRLPEMVKKYIPQEALDAGIEWGAELIPMTQFRIQNDFEGSTGMIWIMVILGTIILLVVTLNYVLTSLSSLSRRAKAIGVHKCSGAGTKAIFSMFLWETGVIIAISLLCMIFLLLNFQDILENLTGVTLKTMFNLENCWAAIGVVLFLFLIGGILPGLIFSHIPVTQVFHRYTEEGRKGWKRPLLFIQFFGVAFIFALLALVLMQTHHITTKERGFNCKRVAYTFFHFGNDDNARSTILNLPYVEDAASCSQPLAAGLSGFSITNDNEQQISVRENAFDKNYLPFAGIKLKAGKNIEKPKDLLVNETFLKTMHWEENPLGRQVNGVGTIVGVMEDFVTGNPAYAGVQPLMVINKEQFGSCVQIRLKEPFDENLKRLNTDMAKIYPQGDIVFSSVEESIRMQNASLTDFLHAALLATITIFFIALMGLIGYVTNETARRSKEIAVRKVNGAKVSSILNLFICDIAITALPAVIIGTLGAWYVGDLWLEQFAEIVAFPIPYYIVIAIAVLLFIFGCVIAKSWYIANENPVKSIKSE